MASFNATEANPIEAIGKVHAPVLLIHGDEDSHIPPDHSQRLHEAAPEHSKLVIIPAANHDTIMMDRDGTIWRETLAWLTEYLE
jgi:dipeptidyl aminopeptidase/acylaminoacyl peptidase